MKAHKLNRRLLLERPTSEPDGSGGFTETWYAMGALWAELTPRTGGEGNAAGGVLSVTGFQIVVRAAPKGHTNRPEPGQRFRHKSRVFHIQAVTEMEPECTFLRCIAQEETVA